MINKIPEKDIKEIVIKMLQDNNSESPYKNNVIRQDKLLWIAREYQKQGIKCRNNRHRPSKIRYASNKIIRRNS